MKSTNEKRNINIRGGFNQNQTRAGLSSAQTQKVQLELTQTSDKIVEVARKHKKIKVIGKPSKASEKKKSHRSK